MMHDMSLVWPTPAEHANKHSLSRYLEVAVYVAQFPQYASALLDHLCDVKVSAYARRVVLCLSEPTRPCVVRACGVCMCACCCMV